MEYPPITGGGASYTFNLISELVKMKTQIVLITSGVKDSVEKVNNCLTIKRFKVLNDIYFDQGGLMQGIDVLLQQIREENPDILHTVYIQETLIGQIANLNYGIPHIVTHTKTPMYREESIKKNSTWSLFDYVNLNDSASYITPGLAYRDSLLQTGIDGNSIHLIYPGIDQQKFKKISDNQLLNKMRTRLKINATDSVILIPCMLRKRKGLQFAARAISTLAVPGHKIKVILTGIPTNEEESRLYDQFRKLIGNVEVIEHERFSDEDMPVLFNIASVTVLCSEAEGYGTVFLEAMACGCPAIGSDVIGINESITNSYNGILCKYGDYGALNTAITKILTNKTLRVEFIKNSFYKLKSRYNLQKQVIDHVNLYRSFCQKQQNVGFVLYRNKGKTVDVFVKKSDKSINIFKTSKNNNISWLEVAIEYARKISGYEVLIPNHKFIYKNNKNSVTYSFKITTDIQPTKINTRQNYLGVWLNLNEAISQVNNLVEKTILKELKTKINLDTLVQKSTATF